MTGKRLAKFGQNTPESTNSPAATESNVGVRI
jgi:hypothetical protein